MRSHEESHGNNFEDHFRSVDLEEDKIDHSVVFSYHVHFHIEGEEDTIDHDDEEDELIEPWIYYHQLDDLVSKRIRNGKTAQGHCCIVLHGFIAVWGVVIIRIGRHGFLHSFHILDTKLSQSESSNLLSNNNYRSFFQN